MDKVQTEAETILLVEDDDLVRETACELLKLRGYQIFERVRAVLAGETTLWPLISC